MLDLQDKSYCPSLEEIGESVKNPVFLQFCSDIKTKYKCKEKIEFSSCSWEKGWNVKFKKAGKSLCTIYPRAGYFTIMIVIGPAQKLSAESVLPECTGELQDIYHHTKEGNGQKWLMIDLEDKEEMYFDVLRLIEIRRG